MDAIGLAALILAIVALVLTLAIERLKKPRIKIVSSEWRAPAFVQWTFATARVQNKKLWPLVRWFLERRGAQGCRAEIEYYQWDATAPFLRIPGRWSSSPPPIDWVPSSLTRSLPGGSLGYIPLAAGPPVTGAPPYNPVQPEVTAGTAPTVRWGDITAPSPTPSSVASGTTGSGNPDYVSAYVPSRDPGQSDITADPDGEEIAVAILRNGEVFAFSTESYRHPTWGNPDWQLSKQVYRVVIRVHGAGVRDERSFKLDCLDPNPGSFRLDPVGSAAKRWQFWKRT